MSSFHGADLEIAEKTETVPCLSKSASLTAATSPVSPTAFWSAGVSCFASAGELNSEATRSGPL